jgi:hypothetical protein
MAGAQYLCKYSPWTSAGQDECLSCILNQGRLCKHAPSTVIARGVREAHRTDCAILHDKQDVRVPRQHRREFKQHHLERVKLSRARVHLQRLDQLASALVPRRVQVVRGFSGAVVGRGGSGDNGTREVIRSNRMASVARCRLGRTSSGV